MSSKSIPRSVFTLLFIKPTPPKPPLWILLLTTACLISGCHSAPDSSDIQHELVDVYACPVLQLSEVQKTDGAESDGKSYTVSFSHTVSLKESAKSAAGLFAEWAQLEQQAEATQLSLEKALYAADVRIAQTQSKESRNADPEVLRLVQHKELINTRLATLVPCTSIEAVTRLQEMRVATETNWGLGQKDVAIAIRVRGSGQMQKAESGWHFSGIPMFSTQEIITAHPDNLQPTTEVLK